MAFVRRCAFKKSFIHSFIYQKANELPLYFRRKKLTLQFATKVAAYENNPVYETILNPPYVDLLRRKPKGIHSKESLEEFDFDPDIIVSIF